MNSTFNNEPIAIIGMSCRFSEINNLDDFWQVLYKGKSVVKEIQDDRWNHANYFDSEPSKPWKTNQNAGAFLENINHFDPYFFHISPKEAIEMSPSQKLMMELSWESFENSSLKKNDFFGSKTGVFIGNIWSDFEHLRKLRKSEINNFSALGQSGNIIANRISYFFGLKGPSLVLDTGCSASLVALMQAVQSLRDKSSNMCIAGGVNHLIDPDEYVYLAKFGGLSSNGKCSAFDANADGFVRGEGAGLVLLKRLEDAEKDNDKILAVIRGGAVTNNGFNVNMPATSKKGQLEVLDQAYKNAEVSPAEVDFIETHGTGTKQGDPVETGALGEFFGKAKNINSSPLLIGSVKTNIGHCEASSGIAGLIKAVLALQHQTMPRNINFNTPNPKIDFKNLNLQVPIDNVSLQKNSNNTIKAGVSSYGWGGTNVHVVLEEYNKKDKSNKNLPNINGYYLPLSGHTPQALLEQSNKYKEHLSHINNEEDLKEICLSTAIRKTDFEYKKLFFGKNKEELIKQLENTNENDLKMIKPDKDINKKVVFVFPGQGAQWLGMGRELYEKEPVFKDIIDKCELAFNKYVDWSLKEEVYANESDSRLKEINVIQPYLFAMQMALSKLWISKGVEPDAVVGHSMGEIAAACLAGALTIDDAANIICSRSILMNTLSGKGGAMVVTELDVHQAEEIVKNYNGQVSLAVQNSPKSVVLAGENECIQEIINDLTTKDLFCRQVKVDVASHSPQMDAIKDKLFDQLQNICPQENKLPIYSTVANKLMEGKSLDAKYWKNNLRGTVQFASITKKLMSSGHNVFVEVSPHSVLSTAIKECADHFNYNDINVAGTLHREYPSGEEFAKNLALVYQFGFKINWQTLFQAQDPKYPSLPSYPFQRKNYEIKDLSTHFEVGVNNNSTHPLIGNRIKLAESDTYYWESKLSLLNLPYLSHHQVNDTAVFPGGFYIEMILSAIKQVEDGNNYTINDLKFVKSIELVENTPVNVQIKIESQNNTLSQFKIYKKIGANDPWEMTCFGSLELEEERLNSAIELPELHRASYDKTEIYKAFNNLGVTFKDYFQNVEKIEVADNTSYATINLKDKLSDEYTCSPILLDNCLHPLFSKAFPNSDSNTIKTTFVQGVQQIKFNNLNNENGEFYVATDLNPLEFDETGNTTLISGDIRVYDKEKNIKFELLGVSAKVIDTGIERVEKEDVQNSNLIESIAKQSEDKDRIKLISNYLLHLVAEASKASIDQLDLSMTFKNMGIDSLTIVQLRNIIEDQLDLKLTISMFYEFPSIGAFSDMLNELLKSGGISNEMEALGNDNWLVTSYSNQEINKQLFLFHDAGGSIRLFDNWSSNLDPSFELITIQLPGRDNRTSEQLSNDINYLLENIVPHMSEKINSPFYVYGHSMGGLLAFEAVRTLQNKFNKTAETLIVSGTPCLKDYNNVFVNNIIEQNYSDEQLLTLLTSSNSNETNIRLENDMIKGLVDIMRNDFELIYGYKYEEQPKLKCSVTAIHAKSDDRVNVEDVKLWNTETEKNFSLIEIEGGHNCVYDTPDVVPSLINDITVENTVNN